MTRTDRLPTNRDVWRIAAPMILSNITVPMLGIVDTAVTGHLDSADYLGAVAIGSTIFGVIYIGFNFLRMGTTGIAAQAYGARDNTAVRTCLGQASIVALMIAASLLVLQLPLKSVSLELLGATGAIETHAAEYFSVRIWSAPATLLSYVLLGWFIGLQDARSPLMVVVTINAINIVLDIVFVVYLGMAIRGVALASVIAEYSGLVVALFMAVRMLKRHPGYWSVNALLRVREYGAFLAVNANLLIRTAALMFTMTFITAQGARLGGLVLAANAVLMQFQNLTSFGLDGIANAAEALVGKAVGARQREALEQAVRLSLRWSLIFAGVYTLVYLVGGQALVAVMTDLDDVRATAARYLPWVIVSPLIAVWSFLYDGVFVGATRAKEMRDIMLISTALVFLPAWYGLQGLGNHGLWAAFMLFLASRGIGMHVVYRRQVLPAVQ